MNLHPHPSNFVRLLPASVGRTRVFFASILRLLALPARPRASRTNSARDPAETTSPRRQIRSKGPPRGSDGVMRREGPKENMKNAFILIKFEKLKLISISPFYQILLGPIEARDRSRATCWHRAGELLEGWWASCHILILTLPSPRSPRSSIYPYPYPYPSRFGLPGTLILAHFRKGTGYHPRPFVALLAEPRGPSGPSKPDPRAQAMLVVAVDGAAALASLFSCIYRSPAKLFYSFKSK